MYGKSLEIFDLSTSTAKALAAAPNEWMAYLRTAGRLYKYPYQEQLLIYAQRPEATACASYEIWNDRMKRYIRRGSKGIALLDESDGGTRLRYVFDIADTGTRANSIDFTPWQVQAEDEASLIFTLSRAYGTKDYAPLPELLEDICIIQSFTYWQENALDIRRTLDNARISEYDGDVIGRTFRQLVAASSTYAVLSRCGVLEEATLSPADFKPLSDFNTPAALAAIGAAVSMTSGHLLRSIERTLKEERRLENERTELHPARGLSDAQPDRSEGPAHREVREDAPESPEAESPGAVHLPADVGQAEQPSGGDRQDGGEPDRADDAPDEAAVRGDGGTESYESDGVGRRNERPARANRRNDPGGTDLQLSFLDIPLPSEAEQIASIDQAGGALIAPLVFPVHQEDIDHILSVGSNLESHRMKIVAEYSKEKDIDQLADFLKEMYRGGHCIEGAHGKVTAWYAEDGIHLSSGTSARYVSTAQIVSWEDAAMRIDELLELGQFATAIEIGGAPQHERYELAERLSYIQGDLSEKGKEQGYLPILRSLAGRKGYPEVRANIEAALADPEQLPRIAVECSDFKDAYRADRSLMRWHYHNVSVVMDRTVELLLPRRTFESDLLELPSVKHYISEDEINAVLSSGDIFHGNKGSIYTFFQQNPTPKEKADDLRKRHGIGGGNAALPGSFHSHRDYDSKGLTLRKPDCPDVVMNWNTVAKRIDSMIRAGRFLTSDEREMLEKFRTMYDTVGGLPPLSAGGRLPDPERVAQQIAAYHEVQELKATHPNDLILYQLEDFFELYGDAAHAAKEHLGYSVHTCLLPMVGQLEVCMIPASILEIQVERLRKVCSVTISAVDRETKERRAYSLAALDAEGQEQPKEAAEPGTTAPEPPATPAPEGKIADRETRRYLVVTYHHADNGFDAKPDYHTLQEAEQAAQRYVDGTWGGEGGAYEGAAVYDQQERRHIRIIGDFPNPKAQAQVAAAMETIHAQDEVEQLIPEIVTAQDTDTPSYITEPVAVYPAEENHLPYDVVIQTLRTISPEQEQPAEESNSPVEPDAIIIPQAEPAMDVPAENFRINDEHLGEGGPKAKYAMNVAAIRLLKELEQAGRQATPDEQEILSRYVGWGGIPDAFDDSKPAWADEYAELKELLTPEEYESARGSTLNAHYTTPTVIRAIYETVGRMGFTTGNILEPSMGVGNFFGMLPSSMSDSRLYGVELDSLTGRIAKQLYPNANITVAGFETTDRRDFYDLAVGNVPFGNYQVHDRAYNKLGFSIHDYFFAKTIDQVRPGGVIAFVTSRYTLDRRSPDVRKYIAQRADFLGAVRLPNNAFRANAGTDVVSDIIFLQKREQPMEIEPDWVHLGQTDDGIALNSYFVDHPEMVLGTLRMASTQYGEDALTVDPIEGANLAVQLANAMQNIQGQYTAAELPDLEEGEIVDSIPADPGVKNYSYTIVDGDVYYREGSRMSRPSLNATAQERVKRLVELRECVNELIDIQMANGSDDEIYQQQAQLNTLYDSFSALYGLINDRANSLAFSADSSYYLLCSLEVLDEEGRLKSKADMFSKRTIRQHQPVTHVDTAVDALAVSIAERAKVDIPYMLQLTGMEKEQLIADLAGSCYKVPYLEEVYVTADEYLSGNVRQKLRDARAAAEADPSFTINVKALEGVQPEELEASSIDARLGAPWIDKKYFEQFMHETFSTPYHQRWRIHIEYSPHTNAWFITHKGTSSANVAAHMTYGTDLLSAYHILEDTLNQRSVQVMDTMIAPDGSERRVINQKETTLAQQKQQAIKDAFQEWVWQDPRRRHDLVATYNELYNSIRPREYDGRHIVFGGMTPEITLREHQRNAVAHTLYGGNTLLAHVVGAGKTFEMIASCMESKRLGLCQKSIFVVPNHLIEQWASDFLRLYPSANILVTTKRDFEKIRRKKFCARIATGDYDAIIIGHSQFERIPISPERQERQLRQQIHDISEGIEAADSDGPVSFTVKQMEKTKRSLETRLKKLQAEEKKDDVIYFEQLGVDRLYVDESHGFKNLYVYTKMRNVAGISTTEAQKSSDMYAKCRYMDEITGGRGIIFATGTPVSNSMTEMYTMQRYLQHDMLQRHKLAHFDSWAATFGESVTAIELAPEGYTLIGR